MKKVEEYQKLAAALKEYKVRVPQLEAELKVAMTEQATLDENAFKAEVLQADGWKDRALTAQKNREAVEHIREGIKRTSAAIKILGKELEVIQPEAINEIKAAHWGAYEKTVRTFIVKLREAEPLERELRKIADKATAEMRACGYPLYGQGAYHLPHPVLVESCDSRGGLDPGALECLIAWYKKDGIEV